MAIYLKKKRLHDSTWFNFATYSVRSIQRPKLSARKQSLYPYKQQWTSGHCSEAQLKSKFIVFQWVSLNIWTSSHLWCRNLNDVWRIFSRSDRMEKKVSNVLTLPPHPTSAFLYYWSPIMACLTINTKTFWTPSQFLPFLKTSNPPFRYGGRGGGLNLQILLPRFCKIPR